MPALPVTEAFAFREPVVNGGNLVLPMLVGGTPAHTHGFRAPARLWREAAQAILRATAPDRGETEGKIRPAQVRL